MSVVTVLDQFAGGLAAPLGKPMTVTGALPATLVPVAETTAIEGLFDKERPNRAAFYRCAVIQSKMCCS